MKRKFHNIISALILAIVVFTSSAQADPNDLNFDGMLQNAADLPKILFLMKREPNGEPLLYEGIFWPNYAYLDTGASGLLLSKDTADAFEIEIDPNGEYLDVGVGGYEAFDVSEPLHFATYIYDFWDHHIENPETYFYNGGPWRLQVKQYPEGIFAIDVLGMPIMAGKTVVFYPEPTNQLDFFTAEIKEPNDPAIPLADFNVPLRFEKYINPGLIGELHTPPLPALAYNPVIDNVIMEYEDKSTTANLVLDTGGTISLMSTARAADLGLTDEYGNPIVPRDFNALIVGIGGQIDIDGYQIDNLILPTLNGYNLVYNNARIYVHDISVLDEDTGEFITIDGIFGSNFFCASYIDLFHSDYTLTPYQTIVLDTQKGLIGFDVNDVYPLPEPYTSNCGDANNPWNRMDLNRDCTINFDDIQILLEEWLEVCTPLNWDCRQADINGNGTVDFYDYAAVLKEWED